MFRRIINRYVLTRQICSQQCKIAAENSDMDISGFKLNFKNPHGKIQDVTFFYYNLLTLHKKNLKRSSQKSLNMVHIFLRSLFMFRDSKHCDWLRASNVNKRADWLNEICPCYYKQSQRGQARLLFGGPQAEKVNSLE